MEKYYMTYAHGKKETEFKRHFAYIDHTGAIYYTGFSYGSNDAQMTKRTITDKTITPTPTGWKEVNAEVFTEKVIQAHRFYKFLHDTAEAIKQKQ